GRPRDRDRVARLAGPRPGAHGADDAPGAGQRVRAIPLRPRRPGGPRRRVGGRRGRVLVATGRTGSTGRASPGRRGLHHVLGPWRRDALVAARRGLFGDTEAIVGIAASAGAASGTYRTRDPRSGWTRQSASPVSDSDA